MLAQGKEIGWKEGWKEGCIKGARDGVKTIVRAKFGDEAESILRRIVRITNPKLITEICARAAVLDSFSEFEQSASALIADARRKAPTRRRAKSRR